MHFCTDFYNFYKYPFWLSCLVIAFRLRALRRTRFCAVSKYLCMLYTPTVYEISNRVWDFIRHFVRFSNALTSPHTRSFSHARFASSIQMTSFCPIIHVILFVFCRRPCARRCFRVRHIFISPSCCRLPRYCAVLVTNPAQFLACYLARARVLSGRCRPAAAFYWLVSVILSCWFGANARASFSYPCPRLLTRYLGGF